MLFALLALTASTATADASVNPLQEARNGSVQCYQPDDQQRTCRSIASYVPRGEAKYANKAVVLLSPNGPVILETITPVTIKSGAVCGFIQAEDVRAGKLHLGGRLLPHAEAAPLLGQVVQSMSGIIGQEICTSYVQTADGLIAKATMNGVYQASADQRVKWVQPANGYSVAP